MRTPFLCKENKNSDFIQQFLLFRAIGIHESTKTHAMKKVAILVFFVQSILVPS